ncbi:hypothetical protein NKH77_10315 [Streptomyces sp. M19]
MVELGDGSVYTAVVFTQAARADSRLPRADAVIGATPARRWRNSAAARA